MRVLGPHDDRRGGSVGHARAVVHTEAAGQERRATDGLHRHFTLELSARVARAVVMVLPRDARQHFTHLLVAEPVLLAVTRCAHREHGRGGKGASRPVAGCLGRADESLIAAVLDLLDADRHRGVVRATRHRIRGVANGFRRCRAEVLDVRHRLVVQLQRTGERHPAHARHRGAEPVRVDPVLVDAGRRERLLGRVDQQVVGALVPVLAERRAPHADDRDLVLDSVRTHVMLLSPGPAGLSRSSYGCRRR